MGTAARSPGTSRLRVAVAAPTTLRRAATALGAERRAWLGEQLSDTRWLLDLELPMSGTAPGFAFRKAAYVDVGQLSRTRSKASVEVSWMAAGLAPLFPVFSGRIAWQGGELRLDGVYAPPGGVVGRAADRLVFNRAAHGTGRWLLRRIAAAMAAAPSAA